MNNAVYNSQFALDQEGWSFSGDSQIEERNGSKAAVIGKKGSISQDLDGRIPGSSRIHVEFYAEAENGGASVTVQLGGDEQTIHVGEGKRTGWSLHPFPDTRFPSPQNGGSMWTISGSIPMSRTAGSMSGTEAREIWPGISGHSMESWPRAVRPQEEWRPERRMRERYIPDSSQGK